MAVKYTEQYKPSQLEPFWPNEIIKMVSVVLCTMAVIMFFAILPVLMEIVGLGGVAEHEEPADPRTTPAHIRPEWYFLSVYQYLKLMPSELLGVEGSALGILSQGVGVTLLLLLPFWYRDEEAGLSPAGAKRAAGWFAATCAAFVMCAWLVGVANARWADRIGVWLHPVFWWPALAVGCWGASYAAGRRLRLPDLGAWMRLFTVTLLLVLFQGAVFVVAFGRWLSGATSAAVGFGVGGALFVASAFWVIRAAVLHVRRRDIAVRRKVFIFTVTENIVLFLGLMLWAKLPHEGMREASGAWTEEARQFWFMSAVILAAGVLFAALVAVERRNITRILGGRSGAEGGS